MILIRSPRRLLRCFTDCLRIRRVTLLVLDERFDIGGRDQPHLVPEPARLAAPEVPATASLHGDNAGWLLAEERQDLTPSQLFAKDLVTQGISPMGLKHILRQIEPDRDNFRHDRSPCASLQTHLGTQMPSEGGHSIKTQPRVAPRLFAI